MKESIIDRIVKLIKHKGVSEKLFCDNIGVAQSTFVNWKKRGTEPKAIYIKPISEFLGVSERYLLTGEDGNADALSGKEKKDIAKEVTSLLDGLNADDALMFDGEEIDDTTRALLEKSLQSTLETARIIAKEKYTPKKYRK